MRTDLLKLLTNLGFNLKQARVYLALLELGEATVQELSRKSGIKRTSLYSLMEGLRKEGLLYQAKRGGRTFLVAEEAVQIAGKFKGRIETFEQSLELFSGIKKGVNRKSRVFFFNGTEGFKKIWEKVFSSGISEYLIIVDPREMLGFVRRGYITEKIIKEKVRRNIKSRQLVAFSEYAKEVIAKDLRENRVSRMLPHIYKVPVTTIIFGDSVALISPLAEDLILIVESEALAKTQRSLFEALWSLLPMRS